MKHLKFTLISVLFLILFSCTIEETETKDVENKVTADALSDEDSTAVREPEMDIVERTNAMQLRDEIDEYRRSIENTKGDLEKGSIDLSLARAKMSQEWLKLDFYRSDDEVVRIKTYPIPEKGEKTEEFYFLDSRLVFAMVKSDSVAEGSESVESGKTFYYDEGELIVNEGFTPTEATEEEKRFMRQATNLQSESKEYLQLVYESIEE